MEMSGQPHVHAALPQGKEACYSILTLKKSVKERMKEFIYLFI
jgi:hypothetical protein